MAKVYKIREEFPNQYFSILEEGKQKKVSRSDFQKNSLLWIKRGFGLYFDIPSKEANKLASEYSLLQRSKVDASVAADLKIAENNKKMKAIEKEVEKVAAVNKAMSNKAKKATQKANEEAEAREKAVLALEEAQKTAKEKETSLMKRIAELEAQAAKNSAENQD